MSEPSAKSDTQTTEQRHFDWGPPASATADSFSDWLVYLIIVIILAGGVWILLDINGRRTDTLAPAAQNSSASAASSSQATASVAIKPVVNDVSPKPEEHFYVQLGAFPDEASAKEVFNQLEAEKFSPTLATPDEQFEIYRIFVGPFASEAAAEDIAEKLNVLEFNCFVIEQP